MEAGEWESGKGRKGEEREGDYRPVATLLSPE